MKTGSPLKQLKQKQLKSVVKHYMPLPFWNETLEIPNNGRKAMQMYLR